MLIAMNVWMSVLTLFLGTAAMAGWLNAPKYAMASVEGNSSGNYQSASSGSGNGFFSRMKNCCQNFFANCKCCKFCCGA